MIIARVPVSRADEQSRSQDPCISVELSLEDTMMKGFGFLKSAIAAD